MALTAKPASSSVTVGARPPTARQAVDQRHRRQPADEGQHRERAEAQEAETQREQKAQRAAQRRAARDAQRVGVGQRIAQQALEQHAGARQRGADDAPRRRPAAGEWRKRWPRPAAARSARSAAPNRWFSVIRSRSSGRSCTAPKAAANRSERGEHERQGPQHEERRRSTAIRTRRASDHVGRGYEAPRVEQHRRRSACPFGAKRSGCSMRARLRDPRSAAARALNTASPAPGRSRRSGPR